MQRIINYVYNNLIYNRIVNNYNIWTLKNNSSIITQLLITVNNNVRISSREKVVIMPRVLSIERAEWGLRACFSLTAYVYEYD